MSRTLQSMNGNLKLNPNVNGVDILNSAVQSNNALSMALNGQQFTDDNFVELSQIIINDNDLSTQLYYELYDKIGLTYIATMSFNNRLKILKKDVLNVGSIVEEIAVDLTEPIPYNPEINWKYELKNFLPVYKEIFHKVNRAEVYPLTFNRTLFKRAMRTPQTFVDFLTQQYEILYTSNEADEFEKFLDDVKFVATNRSFPVNVGNISTKDDYLHLVALINTYANNLTFPSREYNLLNFKRVTPLERIVFITTSQIASELNTMVNQGAFNFEFVKILAERTIIVPSLPDDCLALICDDRVFQIYDVEYFTDTTHVGINASDNSFLHVQQIISASTQFNAVAFYTNKQTNPTIISVDPQDKSVLTKGKVYNIIPTLTPGYKQVKFELMGNTDENTQITVFGMLYIGQREKAQVINVKLTAFGGATQTMTYYISGNEIEILNISPMNGSILQKNNSYQIIVMTNNPFIKPTFTMITETDNTTLTSDGYLTIKAEETNTEIELSVQVANLTQSIKYNVSD